jgi:hypothetical protein
MLSSIGIRENKVPILEKIDAVYHRIASDPSKLYDGMAILMVCVGALLRLRQFAANRSFWIDEASLALNIVNRSFEGLLRPLDYVQGAPVGFLFLQKAIILALGNRDYILRLTPFIASLLSLVLMSMAARMYLGRKSALLALFWFVVSERLIYYASELKQYSSDVLIALMLLFFLYKCLESNASRKEFVLLGCIGLVSIIFSHPSIFILTSGFFVLLLDFFLKKDWLRLRWMLVIVLAHALVFGLLYQFSLRSLAANSGLLRYWQFGFMPLPPWENLGWLKNAFIEMSHNPGGFEMDFLVAAAFFIGAASFFLRRWQLGLILTLPFLEVLVASGLERYPFANRMLMFLFPVMLFFVAEGIERFSMLFHKIDPRVSFGVWAVLAVLVSITPLTNGFRIVRNPVYVEHIKPLLTYLTDHAAEGDIVYIYYGAQPAFDYYSSYFPNLKGLNVYRGLGWNEQEPQKYLEDIDHLKGNPRVWFLFSHNCFWCQEDEQKYMISHLENIGKRYDTFKSTDTTLYLYDLDEP